MQMSQMRRLSSPCVIAACLHAGQRGLAAVARAADKRGPATAIEQALCRHCGVAQPQELIRSDLLPPEAHTQAVVWGRCRCPAPQSCFASQAERHGTELNMHCQHALLDARCCLGHPYPCLASWPAATCSCAWSDLPLGSYSRPAPPVGLCLQLIPCSLLSPGAPMLPATGSSARASLRPLGEYSTIHMTY